MAAPVGEESAGVGEEKFRCSYVQCPAGLGVCGTSCFHPDSQVSVFLLRLPIEVFATQQQQQCGKKKKREGTFAVFIDTLSASFMAYSRTESAAQLGITSLPTQLPCKVIVVVGATLHHPPGDSFL